MKYHNIPTLFGNQASIVNGKNIGTDTVRYIQDAGQKTAGITYIDKNTNELYLCVTSTTSVNNDSNFSKFNLQEAFNKLDNLKAYKEILADNIFINEVGTTIKLKSKVNDGDILSIRTGGSIGNANYPFTQIAFISEPFSDNNNAFWISGYRGTNLDAPYILTFNIQDDVLKIIGYKEGGTHPAKMGICRIERITFK